MVRSIRPAVETVVMVQNTVINVIVRDNASLPTVSCHLLCDIHPPAFPSQKRIYHLDSKLFFHVAVSAASSLWNA